MASTLGGWIHNFTVTDVCTHIKGFSTYKITSIVFPVNIPEALTCVTAWKRFSEVKKLRKIMAKRHKELHLHGIMPDLKDENFFNRFDPHVIQQRKEFILNLLNFISQYPSLYKMHALQSFFEISHLPSSNDNSPESKRRPSGAIETICDELNVPIQPELALIDPINDRKHNRDKDTTNSCSQASSIQSDDYRSCSSELHLNGCSDGKEVPILPMSSLDQVDSSDYIYEAALSFSEAVRYEANGNYRRAFDNYKRGIGILLQHVKYDVIEDRKRIAKEKTKKYLARAEQIYEQYLQDNEADFSEGINSIEVNVSSIERSIDGLSRFKVIKILENVMQVQDNIDKEIFIMKAIEKPSSNNLPQMICLPQNIPFMVNLVAYFQSDATIYLLLNQASGGRLWDYIRSYEPVEDTSLSNRTASLASLFTEPNIVKCPPIKGNDHNQHVDERPFMTMLNQFRKIDYNRSVSNQSSLSEVIENLESNADIPAFDVLSEDMDVLDLVNCSQKLIRSVSNTLDQSRSQDISSDTDSDQQTIMSTVQPNISAITLPAAHQNGLPQIIKTKTNGTKKHIPERSIKRWASEMVICLLSLHENEIFCGDLNPSNLLLGVKGQINLTYFYRQDHRQLKIDCIDSLYVAPERPLDFRSDWWSFGVILFELLTGETFLACHPSGLSSYYEIQYPDVNLSAESMDILERLLQSDPDKRLTGRNIQNHQFFKNINWNEIQDDGNSYKTKKSFSFIYCD